MYSKQQHVKIDPLLLYIKNVVRFTTSRAAINVSYDQSHFYFEIRVKIAFGHRLFTSKKGALVPTECDIRSPQVQSGIYGVKKDLDPHQRQSQVMESLISFFIE